jgi:hypothetical protein
VAVTTWTAASPAVATLSAGSRTVLVQLAFGLHDFRFLRLELGITLRERLSRSAILAFFFFISSSSFSTWAVIFPPEVAPPDAVGAGLLTLLALVSFLASGSTPPGCVKASFFGAASSANSRLDYPIAAFAWHLVAGFQAP